MASVHSVAARMTTSFDATWQNEQQHSAIDTDDLEENPFFIAFKSLPYIQIFLRSALVCIPRSQSIVGLTINRRTLGQYNPRAKPVGTYILTLPSAETHAFLPSPFYKGQFQSLNGKVVAIEKGYVTEVAGKERKGGIFMLIKSPNVCAHSICARL